jgi:DNA-binding response OmpR family regulator
MARLIVVKDDEMIGQAFQRSLTAHAHEVSLMPTGKGALREAGRSSFDLVLLDLGLPDLDGLASGSCRRSGSSCDRTIEKDDCLGV